MIVIVQNDWLAVGYLGDGAVAAALSSGKMKTANVPQLGEYANEIMPLTGRGHWIPCR